MNTYCIPVQSPLHRQSLLVEKVCVEVAMLLTHVKEALLAAAAVAVISRILYLRRTRRQTSLKQEVAIFEQRVRQLHAAGSHARAPCLLDAVPRLAHHFAIGSFSLVQADMERALSPDDASAILASLTAAGVRRAFAVRREVVHFKKACLLVLQDVLRLERGMVRQTTFFYRELRRCGDIDGHECSACRAWRDGRRHELDHCLRGNALAPAYSACSQLTVAQAPVPRQRRDRPSPWQDA